MNRKHDKTLRAALSAALSLLLVLTAGFMGEAPAYAEGEGPVFTVQPESVEVEHPAGASFHVEVEDPENVASYQWYMSDGNSLFKLDGTSAVTDTLVLPSIQQEDDVLFFACTVTDKDGNETESQPATLTNTTRDDYKPVLYVGEYALEPGQSMDLADKGIGSGRVEFAADGVNITLTDFVISNETQVFDSTLSASNGLYLHDRDSEVLEYYVHLKGNNVINNSFFDADYNAGGVDFNSFFACGDDSNAPTIVIDGDGTLTLNGGGNQLYTDGNFDISARIITNPYGLRFCDGIHCRNLLIEAGTELELNVNGTAIHTDGDLRMFEGSKITAVSKAPHVSVGPTSKNVLFIGGSVYMKSAQMDIKGTGVPENFLPYGAYLAGYNGIMLAGDGGINLADSKLSVDMSSLSAERVFTVGLGGIFGAGTSNYVDLANGSVLDVNVDGSNSRNADGIAVPGIISAEKSTISVKTKATGLIEDVPGEAYGVEADRAIQLKDSDLDVSVVGVSGSTPYGIVCGDFSVDFSGSSSHVSSVAKGGVALAADTGERSEEPMDYDLSKDCEKIHLSGTATIAKPEDCTIGRLTTPGYAQYIIAESVFTGSEKKIPAEEVVINGADPEKFGDVAKDAYYHDAVYWAVDKGITLGTSESSFSPDRAASRADFVRFLYRAAGSPEVSGELPFTDISESDDWYKAVLWAFEEGITRGVTDTEFDPSGTVTRGQAVTMLHRRAGSPAAEAENRFTDVGEGDYFYGAVLWATEKGITTGTSETTFSPAAETTRAQIVTFLYRELKD